MNTERVWWPVQVQAYASRARATTGVELPAEYLDRGEVSAVVDGLRVRGGFVLVDRAPFRALAQLPVSERARVEARLAACPRVAEVTGLFLDRDVVEVRAVVGFFMELQAALERRGASHVLFSGAAPALQRLEAPLESELLFTGTPSSRIELTAVRALAMASRKTKASGFPRRPFARGRDGTL